jgi:hypothetical protein
MAFWAFIHKEADNKNAPQINFLFILIVVLFRNRATKVRIFLYTSVIVYVNFSSFLSIICVKDENN